MNKELFINLLRKKRLKLSYPRLLIYQELSDAVNPLSPLELYHCLLKRKRRIGLTSIYRTLELFETLGIAFKIVNGSNTKYKLCESEDHHHHIICKKCGHVVEFKFCDIPNWSKKIIESTGYQITEHQLNFYGFCEDCRKVLRGGVDVPHSHS